MYEHARPGCILYREYVHTSWLQDWLIGAAHDELMQAVGIEIKQFA